MTKDGGFKKVARRHAAETGQRYLEAKAAKSLRPSNTSGSSRRHSSPTSWRTLSGVRNGTREIWLS